MFLACTVSVSWTPTWLHDPRRVLCRVSVKSDNGVSACVRAGRIEGVPHDSSWTFASAVEAGKQIVAAPVNAIASYLWPCSSTPGTGVVAQGRISGSTATPRSSGSGAIITEVTDDHPAPGWASATLRTDRTASGGAALNGDRGGGAMAGMGAQGWAARADSPKEEVFESVGARTAFSGGGVVRSSTRMPATVSGLQGAPPLAGGRVRFDSASDAIGEGLWEEVRSARESSDGPAVRRNRPIFSSK